MLKITEEMIRNAVEMGIKEKDARRGYLIISDSDIGNGAEHVRVVEEIGAFEGDDEASHHAELVDGTPIIRDWTFATKDQAYYLDTCENRKLLLDVFQTMQISLSNAEVKALIKYLPSMMAIAKTFDHEVDAVEAIVALESLSQKFNWAKTNEDEVEIQVDEDKLRQYIDENMILEFDTAVQCMEYLNLYDYQDFKNTEEMKEYQGEYGFSYNGKWYNIETDDALDVYRTIRK